MYPSISGDGRFVAFDSFASNLVPGDTNGLQDIFVHDRATGQTIRASVSSAGEQGNGASGGASISADGRFVAFGSWGTNLVPLDTNGIYDVFVHDRATGQTSRVSVSSVGEQPNANSGGESLSADGRYVSFYSGASNLVPGDSNGKHDVFVHDRATSETARMSVSSSGAQSNGTSYSNYTSLSADGRYVAFESDASNLVLNDQHLYQEIYVHDRQTGETKRASLTSAEREDFGSSYAPSLSDDGRYVSFYSGANLAPPYPSGGNTVFVRDLVAGTTTHVSVNSSGQASNWHSYLSTISGDGRFVVFHSLASNLVPDDTNGIPDVFVHDRETGKTIRASVGPLGEEGNGESNYPVISADGRFVAFDSFATTLVPNDTNGFRDVIVYELGPPLLQYYALGDSIASGEGLAGTTGDCRRSPAAYPSMVATGLGTDFTVEFHHLACAGALASPLGAPGAADLASQVEGVISSRDPRVRTYVTMSIGWSDLDISTAARQRQILCDDPPDAFRAYRDAVGARIGQGVKSALERLLPQLPQPGISVVLIEMYQPFNAYPSYLDDPVFVGSAARLPCDSTFPASRAPHQARARAESLVSSVNDVFREVVTGLDPALRGRVRVAGIQRGFQGHEAAAHASGFCGSGGPTSDVTWIQYPFAGPATAQPGDCLFPNPAGALQIATSALSSIPDGILPPPDTGPPTSAFETDNGAILLTALGDRVSGRVTDDGSGVAFVELAFEPLGGATTFLMLDDELACTPNRRTCWFDVAPPEQGIITVRARAADQAGNDEDIHGPRITVMVV